jgi:hypothetical protein
MFTLRSLTLVLITISYTLCCLGQDDTKLPEVPSFAEAATNPFHSRLMPFLSEGEGAWMVTVTQTGGIAGGIAGGYRLIAAVNSDGNALCEQKSEFRAFPLKMDFKTSLFEVASKLNFNKIKPIKAKNKARESSYKAHCSDCYDTFMEVFERGEKGRLKIRSFSSGTLDLYEESLAALYSKVLDNYECPAQSE